MGVLQEKALKALTTFRQKVSEEPARFESHAGNFRIELENCADRNKHEGGFVRNFGLTQDFFESNFNFPKGIKFNANEYLVAEYLLFASRTARKALVQEWRNGLDQKAANFYRENQGWDRLYSKISRFSFEYLDLKTASLGQRLDRKTLYAIRKIKEKGLAGTELSIDDLQYPIDFANKLDTEFRKNNIELLNLFGVDNAGVYYRSAEKVYANERALKYAAVAGGATLACTALEH